MAAQTSGNNSAAAVEQEAQNLARARALQSAASIVTVELLGIGEEDQPGDDEKKKKKKNQQS